MPLYAELRCPTLAGVEPVEPPSEPDEGETEPEVDFTVEFKI